VLHKLLREAYERVASRRQSRGNLRDADGCAESFSSLTTSSESVSSELQQSEFQRKEIRLRYGKLSAIRKSSPIALSPANSSSSTVTPTSSPDAPTSSDNLWAAADGERANRNAVRMTELDRGLAELLVERGVLNRWQAEQLLEGRTKFTLGNYLIVNAIGKGGYGHVFLGRECEVDEEKNKPILRESQSRQVESQSRQVDAQSRQADAQSRQDWSQSRLVESQFGRGEFGEVQWVALKVLPITKSTPELSERFRKEITLQKKLRHANLVRFIDSGHDGSVDFMVHEFIDGCDVRALLQREGVLQYDAAAAIIAEIAKGVQYLHEQGIIHRDIKPANILISAKGEAKLIDFGLSVEFNCKRTKEDAANLDAGNNFDKEDGNVDKAGGNVDKEGGNVDKEGGNFDKEGGNFDKEVTQMATNKIAGTVDYVAPDQICKPNEPVPAWDIYSIGCSFYQLLTGKVPFPKGDMQQKLYAHVNLQPPDPRTLNQSIPYQIARLALKMLSKNPNNRPKSANEIIQQLESWIPPDGLAGQIVKE
jgi:serine/threonine protein kinase